MNRRWLLVPLLLVGCASLRGEASSFTPEQYAADFHALWHFVGETYAYFDSETHRWETVPERYAGELEEVSTTREFVSLLESLVEELRDHHAHLNTNTPSSPNLVPSRTDLWGARMGGRVVITQVRPGSSADSAGVMPGMEVLEVDGVPMEGAIRQRLGGPDAPVTPRARQWALNTLLAGRRNEDRHLRLRHGDRDIAVVLAPSVPSSGGPLLGSERLAGDLGYIRVRNSLGDLALVQAFDSALASLSDTRGLVLDLRDTPSGGNTAVARGLMGRLIRTTEPYQMHRIPVPQAVEALDIPRAWIELVSPRGPSAYTAPVVVLVGRWTGSMGEGIAIGLDGMGRATVVGTPMAGLRGATYATTLPHTGISVSVPAERLFHLDGTPREDFVPPVLVDLQEESGSVDPILAAGMETLRARIDGAGESERNEP